MQEQEQQIIEQFQAKIATTDGNGRYDIIQQYKAFLEAALLRKQLELLGTKVHSA